jgi:hypothetical protein
VACSPAQTRARSLELGRVGGGLLLGCFIDGISIDFIVFTDCMSLRPRLLRVPRAHGADLTREARL